MSKDTIETLNAVVPILNALTDKQKGRLLSISVRWQEIGGSFLENNSITPVEIKPKIEILFKNDPFLWRIFGVSE